MDERVTFNQAKKLREIGYNEPVDMRYIENGAVLEGVPVTASVFMHQDSISDRSLSLRDLFERVNENKGEYAAPAMNSVIDWFEENFGYHIGIDWNPMNGKYGYCVKWGDQSSAGGNFIETRNEALSRVIDLTLAHIQSKE